MNNIKALFRLELKARFGHNGVSKKSLAVKYSLIGLFGAAVYAVYCYFCYYIIQMFHVYEYDYSILLLFTLASQLFMIGFGISSVSKNLYFSGDNELLLRFPVDSTSMFVCKMGVLSIIQAIGTLLLLLPFYITYGVETNADAYYYCMIPLVYAGELIFSLSVANILSIPSMLLASKFKHKHLFTLVLNIVLVAGFFALYMLLIGAVVNFMKDQSLTLFSEDGMKYLSYLQYVYPISLFADVLVKKNLVAAFLGTIGSVVIITALSLFVSKCQFLKIILKNIESEGASFKKKSTNKPCKPLVAVLKREWRDIFRSSNYSFQYLVMACAAPVFVYSCNKLSSAVGSESLDTITLPMITMLVMLIFVTITVSFAGSCISREGDSFYLTKISPVSARGQVLVKVGLYLFVGSLSSIASLAVVMATKQLPVGDGFIIMGNTILFGCALTCFAVKLDMIRPQFPVGGDGELSGGNFATFIALAVGFALSVIEGLFGLVGFVLMYPPFTYGMLTLFNGLIAIGAILWLLIKLPQSYDKIVQR